MRQCELCELPARMYCDSDQAWLCWSCDSKVHGANFLVAKHMRYLLCQICQSKTPWNASGAKVGQSATVCEECINKCYKKRRMAEMETGSGRLKEDSYEEIEAEKEVLRDDHDEEENQVVPLCSMSPLPVRSKCLSNRCVVLKRKRDVKNS